MDLGGAPLGATAPATPTHVNRDSAPAGSLFDCGGHWPGFGSSDAVAAAPATPTHVNRDSAPAGSLFDCGGHWPGTLAPCASNTSLCGRYSQPQSQVSAAPKQSLRRGAGFRPACNTVAPQPQGTRAAHLDSTWIIDPRSPRNCPPGSLIQATSTTSRHAPAT
jgi:hypothetical protein